MNVVNINNLIKEIRRFVYGHSPRDCKEELDKSTRCLGQFGHLQKDCDNDVFCVCCDKKRHRIITVWRVQLLSYIWNQIGQLELEDDSTIH